VLYYRSLAAPGFLSWNVLAASLHANLDAHVNPFEVPSPIQTLI
jgi:hypothetical protein